MSSHKPAASRAALIGAFAAIYVIWGSTYLGIRVAVSSLPPFLMAGTRFLLAGVILYPLLRSRGAPRPTARQWGEQAIIGTFLLLGGNGLVTWSEQRVDSGITSLILGASPVFVVLLDWVRPGGRRPDLPLVGGVVIGLCGLGLLLGPGCIPAGYAPPLLPLIGILASSLCWWVGSLWSKHGAGSMSPLLASSMQMVCGGAILLLAGLLGGEGPALHLAAVTPASWIAFSYLVVVGSLVAYPIYAWLLDNSTPALVSTYAYVNPVVAVILGWLILREPLGPRMIVSAAIIIGSVALITVRRSRAPAR